MIKQSLTFDDILEKKYKILRTSIMLGNFKNREETLSEYEETARKIDQIKQKVYEELLASKVYTTTTLDEELTRLKSLISFIKKRIQERNDFVDDYIKITSNYLDGLDGISLDSELTNYEFRYNNILEYLGNCEQIKELNQELEQNRVELEEKYDNKANSEIINSKLEDELISEFNKIIAKSDYYASLDYTDIDSELAKIEASLSEKKDVLDTFTSSYKALTGAGVTGAEREEYLSYVQDVRIDYYSEIEKKYVLNIYKLILDKENNYDKLFEKRNNIEQILNERENTRHELEISKRDDLEYFSNLCKEQFSIIKSQKFNLENIDKLIVKISDCENKLNELEKANAREEIVSLLEEYSEESPKIEKIELPVEKTICDEVEDIIDAKPNMVVKIKEPIKINVKLATDAAKLVMKKVVIVLEPKKFNGKRDKLKEEELKLEKEKSNIVELEHEDKEKSKITIVNPILDEKDDNAIFDSSRDFGIELDTKEIDNKKGLFETKEISEIKINTPFEDKMVVPTEIFVEESPIEKPKELFKATDPFLDDNEFENNDSDEEEDILSNMPSVFNIGSVKPNNALTKIEDAVNENEGIILPTLGLLPKEEEKVPIVSENYINS